MKLLEPGLFRLTSFILEKLMLSSELLDTSRIVKSAFSVHVEDGDTLVSTFRKLVCMGHVRLTSSLKAGSYGVSFR